MCGYDGDALIRAILTAPQSLSLVAFSADGARAVALVRVRKLLDRCVKIGPLYAESQVRRPTDAKQTTFDAASCVFQLVASTVLRAALERFGSVDGDWNLVVECHSANTDIDELVRRLTTNRFERDIEIAFPLYTHELLDVRSFAIRKTNANNFHFFFAVAFGQNFCFLLWQRHVCVDANKHDDKRCFGVDSHNRRFSSRARPNRQ